MSHLRQLLVEHTAEQLLRHFATIGQNRARVANPLPDLGARGFRGGGPFHQIEKGGVGAVRREWRGSLVFFCTSSVWVWFCWGGVFSAPKAGSGSRTMPGCATQ